MLGANVAVALILWTLTGLSDAFRGIDNVELTPTAIF